MDDVATVHSENENLKKVRARLLQWEAKKNPLASLTSEQDEYVELLSNIWSDDVIVNSSNEGDKKNLDTSRRRSDELIKLPTSGISTTNDFLLWYDQVEDEINQHDDATYRRYLHQLESRASECSSMLDQISIAMNRLNTLNTEYEFVSQKTSALNSASEKLIEEQERLQHLSEEIQRRLHYFNQVDLIHQRLQSPTISVAGESFRDCLNRIDECLLYLKENPKFKDAAAFTVKYKHCLSKAIALVKTYVTTIMAQATEAILHPKHALPQTTTEGSFGSTTPDAIFALYYGKYQTSAAKIKKVAQLIEPRASHFPEYEQLLSEMQHSYLQQRSNIMSPAVDQAIKDIKVTHKGDHCSLMRSACAFLVHICQDEQRLYFQFFSQGSEQLTVYLEGLCNVLYDTMRPFIIHINHLETLAEICSILRIEMLEEHCQQNPEALAAFAVIVNQLLQDVQERLVFRAHLYLTSDILNYNPSAGDLAYPEKLEMMESIALSLQEGPVLKRSDSRSSLASNMSGSIFETETVDTSYKSRNSNSPADLHGMWYPTVRRTLVCLSRLYRCVDRPIFQGLSQEALKLCIQSVSAAAEKITAAKTPVDGELFEIKHLLILREQIAPFRVDFTVKETSLDFSKVKTAAFGLLQKRKQLFAIGTNNAILEFLLEGTPQIKEHLLDSRKEVDRQLKTSCEQFIKDAVKLLVGPILTFIEKANALLASTQNKSGGNSETKEIKVNYVLRQTQWASPQQISCIMQETQRLIKSKLPGLQRSMQLYLSNRDTEFIIFRPIRNNIIQSFVKLEQLLSQNGYSSDDLLIAGCPSAEQVSIILSSASLVGAESVVNFSGTAASRKISTSSNEGGAGGSSIKSTTPTSATTVRKFSFDKKSQDPNNPATDAMENVPEIPEIEESPSLSNTTTSAIPSTNSEATNESIENNANDPLTSTELAT